MVYAILKSTIKQALALHHVNPSLDFDQNVNQHPLNFSPKSHTQRTSIAEKNYAQFKNIPTPPTKDWQQLIKPLASLTEKPSPIKGNSSPSDSQTTTITIPSTANQPPQVNQLIPPTTTKIQIHTRYLLAQVKSGLYSSTKVLPMNVSFMRNTYMPYSIPHLPHNNYSFPIPYPQPC